MVPEFGRLLAMRVVIAAAQNLQVHLFKNDPTPPDDKDVVIADLDEADFDGYDPIDSIAFPTPAINGDDAAETLSPTLTWETTGTGELPQTIYGMYATINDPAGGGNKLFWFERFDAPVSLVGTGEQVVKKLKLLDTNYQP